MGKVLSWLLCFCLALLACSKAPESKRQEAVEVAPKPHASASPPSAAAVERALPGPVAEASASVVRVVSYVADDPTAAPTTRRAPSSLRVNRRGLGVVVEEGGFILTSYELLVREGTESLVTRVEVQLLNDPKAELHEATIVGFEPTLDLAVLRATGAATAPPAAVEARDRVKPGSPLYAVTGGAAKRVHVSGALAELATKECYQESLSATMLRAKLELPPDTVGCPVFSESGKVVGIDTKADHLPHESHAPHEHADRETHLLPIDLAFNIYEALATKQSMQSPWTGFSVRRLTAEEQRRFPVKGFAGGVALEYVWKNGPAEKLGLKTGDILMRFGHYPIRDVASFQKWLYMHGVGARVTLSFLRGTEILERAYVVEERPRWAVPR
ncbi:MAG TPA: S1C family serine protease [Polyangiaceae bacterium]|nr:S1C family serine protease [Polyangiaceae bacterium]